MATVPAPPIAPVRRPLDIDVHDDDEVRRWLMELVAEQVMTKQQPIPAIHLLCDGHEEVLDWSEVAGADPAADLGATWALLAVRRDVERRILVLRLDRENGTHEAAMFEQTWEDGAPAAWWCARRPFAAEAGIGRLLGAAWQQLRGEGRPPEPFASALGAAPGGRPARLLPARAPEPRVWMQTGEMPPAFRFPTTAMEMGAQMEREVLGTLERDGLKHLVVFLIRGRTWEKWLLGDLPMDHDDMIRWICGRLGPAEMVATAEGRLAPVGGKPERVIQIFGELGGRRAERLLVMGPKPGKPESVVPVRGMARELGEVGEGDGWIGVEPVLAGELIAKVLGYGRPR